MAKLADAAATLATGGGGDAECDAVVEVLAYLQRSAHRHVADEEQSLFPRLRAAGVDTALLERIEAEHRDHERLHDRLACNIRSWRTRPPAADTVAELDALAGELAAGYAEHIRVEDSQLLPLVRSSLDQAQLDAVFTEMRDRRGKSRNGTGGKRGGGAKKRARPTS